MGLRDDDNVELGDWPWVVKRQDPIVFIDAGDIDLTGEDVLAVPIAVCHGSSVVLGPRRITSLRFRRAANVVSASEAREPGHHP